MTTNLVLVPRDTLAQAWPHVGAHVEKMAEATRGKLSVADIRGRIEREECQLWVVLEGSALLASVTTEIIVYPQRKVARILGCVGEHRAKWVHLIAEIQDWARANGCAAMEIVARKGWARALPDFQMTHVLLEADL